MADIVLKNRAGRTNTFRGIHTVTFDTEGGSDKSFFETEITELNGFSDAFIHAVTGEPFHTSDGLPYPASYPTKSSDLNTLKPSSTGIFIPKSAHIIYFYADAVLCHTFGLNIPNTPDGYVNTSNGAKFIYLGAYEQVGDFSGTIKVNEIMSIQRHYVESADMDVLNIIVNIKQTPSDHQLRKLLANGWNKGNMGVLYHYSGSYWI